jgi:hypothetical protein
MQEEMAFGLIGDETMQAPLRAALFAAKFIRELMQNFSGSMANEQQYYLGAGSDDDLRRKIWLITLVAAVSLTCRDQDEDQRKPCRHGHRH